jgi:hypothetical protein
LASLFVRKSEMHWIKSLYSARSNGMNIRTSGFS